MPALAGPPPHNGPPGSAGGGGEPFAVGWGACSGGGRQRGVVYDPNPAVAMPDRPIWSLRHDDNALSRTEQPPVDPVIESVLDVFGGGTMKESHPGPGDAQPAQQIRHRRRLVAVGLDDRRSPAAQHASHPQRHSPIDGAAVLHDAMPNAGLLEVLSESRGGPAASMERNDQALDPRSLERTRQSGHLTSRSGDRFGRNQRGDSVR